MFKDYYFILEISPTAKIEDIKRAFKCQAKKWHPDKNQHPDANHKMIDILEAYEILSDDEKRMRYDIEYLKYLSFKKEGQGDSIKKDYAVFDDVLKNWMHDASKKATKNLNKALKDLLRLAEIGITGLKEFLRIVMIGVGYFIIGTIAISIIVVVIEFINVKFDYAEVEKLTDLPEFDKSDGHSEHNLFCFGKFSMPKTMERKTIVDNNQSGNMSLTEKEADNYSGNIISKATFQQKGLNFLDQNALQLYARVLFRTEKITPDIFPINLQSKIIRESEIKSFSKRSLSLIDSMMRQTGNRIIEKNDPKLVQINDQVALVLSYKRKLQNNPPVKVECYFFKDQDILYSITFSFREKDSLIWERDFRKILKSIQFDKPLDKECLGSIHLNQTPSDPFVKIEFMNNLPEFTDNDGHHLIYVPEFGQICLPKSFTIHRNFSSGPVQYNDLYVDNKMDKAADKSNTLFAKINVFTSIGKPGEVPKNEGIAKLKVIEFQKIEKDTYDTYYQIFTNNSRKLLKWEKCKLVSLNAQNAIKMTFTTAVFNYPPVKFEEYHFDNYDRRHVLSLSYPSNDSIVWHSEFQKIINSVRIKRIQ